MKTIRKFASAFLLSSAILCVGSFAVYMMENSTAVLGNENAAAAAGSSEVKLREAAPVPQPEVTAPPRTPGGGGFGDFRGYTKKGGGSSGNVFSDTEEEERPADTIVGSDEEGYFYVNRRGEKDERFCGSVEVDGETWNVINGKASIVVTERDKAQNAALKALEKCTDKGMAKEEKLQRAFYYLQDHYLEGDRRTAYREPDWPVVYANDLLLGGKGDCYSYAAAFAFMAKGIGYEAVYACNSGGHGWAEIDGKIYDPEWSMHDSRFSYYAMGYDVDCGLGYGESVTFEDDWTYVKI